MISGFILLLFASAVLGALKLLPFRTGLIINLFYLLISVKFIKRFISVRHSFIWLIYLIILIIVGLPNTHYLDFLIIVKWIIFLILGVGFASQNLFSSVNQNLKYYRILTNIYLAFYSYLFLTSTYRQSIFLLDESNFELIILFVPAIYFIFLKKLLLTDIVKLAIIVLLCGSRSGLLTLAVLAYLFIQSQSLPSIKKIPIFLFGGILLTSLLLTRELNLYNIDRYKFFLLFINDLSGFGISEIIFGPKRFTPLPPEICNSLSFYDDLLSKGPNKESCYAVIYHSFILRILRDHGIIITILAFKTLFHFVSNTYSKKLGKFILFIVLINSLSVSGIANTFLWIGVLISPKYYQKNNIKGNAFN